MASVQECLATDAAVGLLVDAPTSETAGQPLLRDDLGHERAETARDVMRLEGEHERHAGERSAQVLGRRRLHARHDEDACVHPAFAEGLQSLLMRLPRYAL